MQEAQSIILQGCLTLYKQLREISARKKQHAIKLWEGHTTLHISITIKIWCSLFTQSYTQVVIFVHKHTSYFSFRKL